MISMFRVENKSNMTTLRELENRIKILIVEDDESTRVLYNKALSGRSFEKKFAENGKMGIELYESWKPDIIILDIYLPLMTGYSMLKVIRNECQDNNVSIIISTGEKHEEHVRDCIKFGIQGYITKPFKYKKLSMTIMQCYQGKVGALSKICGGKTTTDDICLLPAGHQTIHSKEGRCRLHERSDPLFPFKYAYPGVKNECGYGICRDKTELAVYEWLRRRHKTVAGFTIEPFKIPYYNKFESKRTTYTPDLLIEYKDGSELLVEIKGIGKVWGNGSKYPANIDKYRAGIKYSRAKDIAYELWVCEVIGNDILKPDIMFIPTDKLIELIDEKENEEPLRGNK